MSICGNIIFIPSATQRNAHQQQHRTPMDLTFSLVRIFFFIKRVIIIPKLLHYIQQKQCGECVCVCIYYSTPYSFFLKKIIGIRTIQIMLTQKRNGIRI